DRQVERLAAPVGQGGVEGAGEVVGKVLGRDTGGFAVGADLREVAVVHADGPGGRAWRDDHAARIGRHNEGLVSIRVGTTRPAAGPAAGPVVSVRSWSGVSVPVRVRSGRR